MLQELRANLTTAAELADRLAERFRAGDPADELIARLAALVTEVERSAAPLGDELTADVREELARLVERLRAAAAGGDAWLTRAAGPELASENLRQRLRRAYGLIPRDDPH